MKLPIAEQSDQDMQFFTRDLYLRSGSTDDEEADRAAAEWEDALARYQEHLRSLVERMPVSVATLAKLAPHDARVLSLQEHASSGPVPAQFLIDGLAVFPVWSVTGVLSIEHQGKIIVLFYHLWREITRSAPAEDWEWADNSGQYWLYDEVDVAAGVDGRGPPFYAHRILLSTGEVLKIPFLNVVIHEIPLENTPPERSK